MIKQWLEKRKALKNQRAFYVGFDWAAGKLLANAATAEEIVAICNAACAFDSGALEAVEKWEALKK
jgi:hypothetical protein